MEGALSGLSLISTNAAGVVLRDAAFIKTFFGGTTPVLPAPTEFLQVADSNVSIGEKINYLALAILKYNPITLTGETIYKMGGAAIDGNWEALRNESYNLLTLSALMKFGESAKLKRDIQLSVKNTEFLQQQMRRGVIEETPLKDIQSKPAGVAAFGVETAKRDANGVTLSERPQAVLTEKTLVNDAKGSLEVNAQGKVEPACFTGTTLVHTYDDKYGVIFCQIEDIFCGALVLSRCETTGELAYRPVINTFEHWDREIWAVTHTDDRGFTETLSTTAEHPFWVKGRGWVPVSQLELGQVLEVAETKFPDAVPTAKPNQEKTLATYKIKTSTVVEVVNINFKAKVYNIEVEGHHTYFVGELGAWVHNKTQGQPTIAVRDRSTPANVPKGTPPEVPVKDPAGILGEIKAANELAQHNYEVIHLSD